LAGVPDRRDSPPYRVCELPRRNHCKLASCSTPESMTAYRHRAAKAAGILGNRPSPISCGPSSSAPARSPRPRTPRIAASFASVDAVPRCTSPRAVRTSHAPQIFMISRTEAGGLIMDWEVLLRGANLYRKAEPERERADCENADSEHRPQLSIL